MGKITCVGSTIVDITGFAPHLPIPGESVIGTKLTMGPGGKGSNQITAARRAGCEVAFISRLGDDAMAEVSVKHFKDCDIDMKYIPRVAGETTSCAVIAIETEKAQNQILVVPTACMNITAADVEAAEAEFADADVVLVQYETSTESILKAKELAKKYGKIFVINPAPFREMPAELLDGADFITPNETEAGYLTGLTVDGMEGAAAAAKKLLAMGVKNVVITLGVNGAYYTDGKTELHVPGLRVKAVETTGAGDAFNGGLVTALSEGLDVRTALQFANCTGALSVTRHGAGAAMPYRHEILDMLKTHYGTEL